MSKTATIVINKDDYVIIETIPVKIKLLTSSAKVPTYGTPYSAGADLYLDLDGYDSVTVYPDVTLKAHTGIALEIKEGYFGAIYARSSLASKKGIRPANCVGVIDSDYRGEIIVPLRNDGNEAVELNKGDRIAQIIFSPYKQASFEVTSELSDTNRGAGGFGSTGR